MLPTMLVIGARKSATGTLWGYLDQHPDTFLARPKELHFFDRDANYRRGEQWYAAHFRMAGAARAVGEATPAYTRYPAFPDVPKRASALLPDARLIYIMRDPIARLRSDYVHDWRNGRERRAFADAVLAEDSVHLVTSCYAVQIEQWLDYYDREQLLLVTTEELASDRAGLMARVYAHIGVDPTFVPEPEQRNTADASRYLRPPFLQLRGTRIGRQVVHKLPRSLTDVPAPEAVITPALRAELVDRLAPDVARLREWMPDSFDGWGIG